MPFLRTTLYFQPAAGRGQATPRGVIEAVRNRSPEGCAWPGEGKEPIGVYKASLCCRCRRSGGSEADFDNHAPFLEPEHLRINSMHGHESLHAPGTALDTLWYVNLSNIRYAEPPNAPALHMAILSKDPQEYPHSNPAEHGYRQIIIPSEDIDCLAR